MSQAASRSPRAMGLPSLAAVGVNSIIGAGFYLLPAQYFATAGAWTPIVLLVVGLLMFAIALCFAEVGSRFRENGGAYLYARHAFGPLVGFEIGWVLYLSRVISTASMFAALILLLDVTTGRKLDLATTSAIVIALATLVAAFSIVGGRTNAGLLTTLAILKIAPVVVLIGMAIPRLDTAALAPSVPLTWQAAAAAAAMGMFSYAGFENLAIPAGEARDPQRDVPRALVTSLAAGIVLLVGANTIAIGLVPNLADSRLALGDAAAAVLGPTGWWAIAATAILAVVGSNAGALLANSRLLQSLADQGDIAGWFGRRSARFGTPVVAIAVSSGLVVALALTGTFQSLVVLAVGTRVLVYLSVALASIRLRGADRAGRAPPASYRMPAAPLVVTTVGLGCAVILIQMTAAQALAIGMSLMAGLLLFAARRASAGRS